MGSLPLVAIGGITLGSAREVLRAGADAIAVIGALIADPTRVKENMSKMLS